MEGKKPADGDRGNNRFSELWRRSKRTLLVVAFGVVLYQVLANLPAVTVAVKSFLSILEPVFIGIIIAFLANMPLSFLEKHVFKRWKKHRLRRVVTTVLSFIFVLAAVIAVMLLIIPKMVDSVVSLADGFDGYVSSLTRWADGVWQRIDFSPDIETKVKELASQLFAAFDSFLTNAVSYALRATISVLGFVIDLLIAFIIGFYALYNKEKLTFGAKKLIVAALDEHKAERVMDVCSRTYKSLHDYFFGMITECTILGVMTYLMMVIFGFPYAVLISVCVGVTQMIPIIGPWVSGAFGVLIIFVTDPPMALWFALGVFVVQQLEANLVYPRVVGRAVGLSGIWVLIAVILGGGLFGIVGIVLCVPIMAVVYTLVSEWINRRVEEKRFAKGMRKTPPTEDEIKRMTEP